MIIDSKAPPTGTIRDWLSSRADEGGLAFVFPETNEHLNWPELQKEAYAFARCLTMKGAQKGESVVIMSPNSRGGIIAFYGAVVGGFRATMINLAAGRDAISYALRHSRAQFGFVDPVCLEQFNEANQTQIKTVQASVGCDALLFDIHAEDDALLMYTSGTTGRPKGVLHSHRSLLAGGWTTAIAHELGQSDRGFCILPFYHINGLCVTVMGSLVSGSSLAMVARFSSSKFWKQAETAEITWFSAVPTIISHLLHAEGEPRPSSKKRIRFGRSASSALAVETQAAFESRFGIPIVETMGLTETAAQILSNPLPPGTRKVGSPGIGYGCEVDIQNDAGQTVANDVEGEIVVRGANVMRGYLNDANETEKAFRGEWLRTGDLGHRDKDGYFFVTGRLKELIIKGGENIAPREIDEVLYAHPDVIEAAAFARKCKRYGETVEAAVRIRAGSTLESQVLIQLCEARLGPFKAPDHVHFLDDLPKGPSGKIQRLKLAEIL